jgi:Tfp pilus assembly protein PilV
MVAANKRYACSNYNQRGVSIIEVLVGVLLLSLIGLSVAKSIILSSQLHIKATNQALASQIAQETLEDYYDMDFSDFEDGQTMTDTVERDDRPFERTQIIGLNSDDSTATVSVTILATNDLFRTRVSMQSTYVN